MKVTNIGLVELGHALKHMNSLHCFHLNISRYTQDLYFLANFSKRVSPKLTDDGLMKLWEALESMSFLRELSLFFEGYLFWFSFFSAKTRKMRDIERQNADSFKQSSSKTIFCAETNSQLSIVWFNRILLK